MLLLYHCVCCEIVFVCHYCRKSKASSAGESVDFEDLYILSHCSAVLLDFFVNCHSFLSVFFLPSSIFADLS